jgi:hypothetical protein
MNRRKFVQVTESCAAFFTIAGIFVACKDSNDNEFEDNLRLWSIDVFKRFEEVWNFKDFRKRGNTLDSCLTF